MITLRRLSQVFFLLVFIFLFLLTVYPTASRLPVDLFLKMDPLTVLSTAISGRSLSLISVPALLLIIATVVLGRFFCGWICPLGATIDGVDHFLQKSQKRRHAKKIKWIKFFLLTLILVASVFSVQMAGYLGPLTFLTRSTVVFIYPVFVYLFERVVDTLMSLHFFEVLLLRISEGLKGILLPVHPAVFRGSLFLGATFILILFLGFVNRRFWCQYMCPTGALVGLFSRFRRYRRTVSSSCIACSKCVDTCRMDAIYGNYHDTCQVDCVSCMDCVSVCPVNAVSFRFQKRSQKSRPGLPRRQFLAAGTAGVLSASLMKIGFSHPVQRDRLIRPPGAWNEPEFLDRCIRCGACIRVCSSTGAGLQLTAFESGLEGILTPKLVPETGFCEFNCNLCGEICPAKAIQPLSLAERQHMIMGTALIDRTRCVAWYAGEHCQLCKDHCPLPEKAIRIQQSMVPEVTRNDKRIPLPFVDESLCNGCGACVTNCPVEGHRGIYLTNKNETRWHGS